MPHFAHPSTELREGYPCNAPERMHPRSQLAASFPPARLQNAVASRLLPPFEARPQTCGLLRSLAVLLLDPRGDVEAPRVGHEERAKNVEAIHCASAKDVQQVALGDAVEADAEGKA